MTVKPSTVGECRTAVVLGAPDAKVASIVQCHKPSVVLVINWAGRSEFLCREHAEAVLAEFGEAMKGREETS
ncbi:MAG: hypothetical protein AB7G11_02265 [Phycisphaerales bacterium]